MCYPVQRMFFSLFLYHTPLDSSHITSSIEWLIPTDITGRYRCMSQKRQTLLSNGFTVSYHSRRFVPKIMGSSAKKGREKKENRRPRTWIYSVHTLNGGRADPSKLKPRASIVVQGTKKSPSARATNESANPQSKFSERRRKFRNSRPWLVDELNACYAEPIESFCNTFSSLS